MANRPVFSGGVHALQDNEKGPLLFGIEQVLQVIEAFEGFCELVFTLPVILVAQGIGGIIFRQLDFLVRWDHQFAAEIHKATTPERTAWTCYKTCAILATG